uniref:GTPase Der n=1 Tax=Lotharella globosa TaxID=91324 RepID=A0A7S3YNW2_9EUKA
MLSSTSSTLSSLRSFGLVRGIRKQRSGTAYFPKVVLPGRRSPRSRMGASIEDEDSKVEAGNKDMKDPLQDLLRDLSELEGAVENVKADEEKKQKRKELYGGGGPQKLKSRRPKNTIQQKIPIECLPKVAIVGQPNVGKSELFNRLTGEYKAIVYDTPGVTRDRMYGRSFWGKKEFVVVDTGGLTRLPQDVYDGLPVEFDKRLPYEIEKQAAAAIAEADAVIFVVDGRAGLSESDREIAAWLRHHRRETAEEAEQQGGKGKPVILAVNKCESADSIKDSKDYWELGLEPFAISAKHGSGTAEMLDALLEDLPDPKSLEELKSEQEALAEGGLALAILGRPNVGKSSLLNALVGEDRAVVSSTAGTTRDAVDTTVFCEETGDKFRLVDTAGIRKRAKVGARSNKDGFEGASVQQALRAMKRADVAVLVLDAQEGVLTQDFRLAELVAEEGRGCLILVNKWDLLSKDGLDRDERMYKEGVRAQLRPVSWAPILPVSAFTGKGTARILEAAAAVGEQHGRTVSTATLNLCIQDALAHHVVSRRGGKMGRVYYGTQVSVRPPTFLLFVNDRQLFAQDEGYQRYLERRLRKDMGLEGTPIRILFRESKGDQGKGKGRR